MEIVVKDIKPFYAFMQTMPEFVLLSSTGMLLDALRGNYYRFETETGVTSISIRNGCIYTFKKSGTFSVPITLNQVNNKRYISWRFRSNNTEVGTLATFVTTEEANRVQKLPDFTELDGVIPKEFTLYDVVHVIKQRDVRQRLLTRLGYGLT